MMTRQISSRRLRANMTACSCGTFLNAMLESVQEMLAEDGNFTLTGFGTFVAETSGTSGT